MIKQKIVVVQYWTENLSYSKYTKAINEKYCNDNDYIYHVESNTNKILNEVGDRAITWYKPKLINEVFELYNPDYILFLDADAIVCDDSYKIEYFIEKDINIICTEDYGPSKINAGVFIMKNTNWTKKFLNDWWGICEITENKFYKHGLWHDQTCFGLLMDSRNDIDGNIKIIENNKLNGRFFRDSVNKNFIFHAFSFGHIKNRTIDGAYCTIFNIKPIITNETTLDDIAKIYTTDKSYGHDYYKRVYHKLYNDKRDLKRILEFSLSDYYNSFKVLYNYFEETEIIGAFPTLNDEIINDEKVKKFIVNQSSENDLLNLKNSIIGEIDLIVDCGEHKMFGQQKTLALFFEKLSDDGVFIIESIHTSIECKMPEKAIFNWGDINKTTTLDLLEEFNKTGKIKSDYLSETECKYLEENIKSCVIYNERGNDSIIAVLTKKKEQKKL